MVLVVVSFEAKWEMMSDEDDVFWDQTKPKNLR